MLRGLLRIRAGSCEINHSVYINLSSVSLARCSFQVVDLVRMHASVDRHISILPEPISVGGIGIFAAKILFMSCDLRARATFISSLRRQPSRFPRLTVVPVRKSFCLGTTYVPFWNRKVVGPPFSQNLVM